MADGAFIGKSAIAGKFLLTVRGEDGLRSHITEIEQIQLRIRNKAPASIAFSPHSPRQVRLVASRDQPSGDQPMTPGSNPGRARAYSGLGIRGILHATIIFFNFIVYKA
jgi:hypothetical protein